MALLSIKASKKIETTVRLEESTAKLVDRYAHFAKASADDVVNQALEYVFTKDKDFQQHIEQHPDHEVPSALRVKKTPGNGNGTRPVGKNGAAAASSAAK
jgi:hypothetical protein